MHVTRWISGYMQQHIGRHWACQNFSNTCTFRAHRYTEDSLMTSRLTCSYNSCSVFNMFGGEELKIVTSDLQA